VLSGERPAAPSYGARAVQRICEEFTREVNRLRIERRTDQDTWAAELARIEKQIRGIITATITIWNIDKD
jgi:hypothetical protein